MFMPFKKHTAKEWDKEFEEKMDDIFNFLDSIVEEAQKLEYDIAFNDHVIDECRLTYAERLELAIRAWEDFKQYKEDLKRSRWYE